MVHSAIAVSDEMQGFKLGYIQSDEASFLLTDYDKLETEAWFGYNKSKIESVSASLMTGFFNDRFYWDQLAFFDSRSFNIPKEEVSNYFLWRTKDWKRNSLQMYCRSFFSQKELHGKKTAAMHEMLHSIGKNWATDLSGPLKNGTFIFGKDFGGRQIKTDVTASHEDISALLREVI